MSYQIQERYSRVSKELGGFLNRLSNAHIAVPLMFVMIFLWLNGTALWGPYWETSTALAYIIMFAFVFSVGMAQKNSLMWLTKLSFSNGIKNFWIGFVIMFAGLIVASQFLLKGLGGNTISQASVYPQIALTALFVAPVEETIFRGVLKEYFRGWRVYGMPIAIVLTSGAFAITHYAVYGGAVMSIWWAVIMGGVFYMATNFKPGKTQAALGVPGSIGMHTCYNLFVLGILSGGIIQ